MSEWWENPYPRGQMLAVKGFPRPLYPPGAEPAHVASVDGSDVEAYKRTVSRAGRWKWQPFDQTYSNGFADGKAGGNVGESGIAGVQRQQSIDPTGYVGEQTFKTLRSIKIPEGLPNAGQYAMDARAVELVNAAWDRFKGSPVEPPAPEVASSAEARLAVAIGQIGVTEQPRGSNKNPYGSWYGMNGVPWCAIFCTWCDQLSKNPSSSFVRGARYAYVPYVVSDGRMGWNGLAITSNPKPGDLVCFDWSRDGEFDHIGLVVEPPGANGTFESIEGNTSVGNNSNGGAVMTRTRNRSSQGTVFVRVAE